MKTILVVDDDEAIRTLLQEELEEEGYKVLIATNARDALKMVAAEPLDLVVLDIRMPGMDGLEALPRMLLGRWTRPMLPHLHDPYMLDDRYMAQCLARIEQAVGALVRAFPGTRLS